MGHDYRPSRNVTQKAPNSITITDRSHFDLHFRQLAKATLTLLIIDDFGLKPMRSLHDEDFHNLTIMGLEAPPLPMNNSSGHWRCQSLEAPYPGGAWLLRDYGRSLFRSLCKPHVGL